MEETKIQPEEDNLQIGQTLARGKTFAQVVDEFMEIHVSTLKPSTIVHYEQMKKRPLDYFGSKEFSTVKAIDIERFMLQIRRETSLKGAPLAPKTVKHIFAFLRALFNFAVRYDLIDQNPMVKVSVPTVPAKKLISLMSVKRNSFWQS